MRQTIKKVSILIPCYNEENTIDAILKEVEQVNLGTTQKEVIIVDDCSKDGTRKILKKLEKSEAAALIHADVFGVKARQEDKAVRINITLPKSLLEAVDFRAQQLGVDRSKLLQKAAREVI